MNKRIGNMFASKASRRSRPQAARRAFHSGVESLEARAVPALLYSPLFGAESVLRDGGNREGSNPVYVIYNGNNWGGSASSAVAQQYTQAASKLLASGYLSALDQYGVHNFYSPTFATGAYDATPLTSGFSTKSLDDTVQRAINNHSVPAPVSNVPLQFPPIYVVVTDPLVRDSSGIARGYNTITDGRLEVWVNGDSVDGFTKTLSHELAELMTDPGTNGYEVNPGPEWTGTLDNQGQIGDYEGAGYAYRMLNGVVAQPYWSNTPKGWIGPGASSALLGGGQTFNVTPVGSNRYSVVVNGDQGGPNQSDQITVTTANGVPEVILNGEVQPFDLGMLSLDANGKWQYVRGAITGITINTGGGNDSVTVENVASTIPVTIHLGSGRDSVSITPTSQDIASHIKGSLSIDSTGTYSLTLGDLHPATPPAVVSMSQNGIAGLYPAANFSLDMLHMTNLTADVPGGGTINEYATPTGSDGHLINTDVVIGGAGGQINVYDNQGAMTIEHDPLGGADQVNVINNSGPLNLFGSNGSDVYNVTANHGQLTIDGRGGSDTYNLHWDSPSDSIGAWGTTSITNTPNSGGNPVLNVFDANHRNGFYTQYDVSKYNITRYGINTSTTDHQDSVNYSNMSQVILNTGLGGGSSGANTITVHDTGTKTVLNTGLGLDTISVQHLSGPTTINDLGTRGATISAAMASSTADLLLAPLTVNGDTGTRLTLSDAGAYPIDPLGRTDSLTNMYLSAMSLTRLGILGTNVESVNYHGLQGLTLNPGQNYQTVLYVLGTPQGTSTTINGASALALVDVGNGSVQNIKGPLNIHGTSTSTGLALDDSSDRTFQAPSLNVLGAPFSMLLSNLAPAAISADGTLGGATISLGLASTIKVGSVPTSGQSVPSITIDGRGNNNTLQGTDGANDWQINTAGAGTLDSTIAFKGMTNLQGGAGPDTFSFHRGINNLNGSVSGQIDGGSGVNTLNYSSYGAPVFADIPLRSATGVGGTIGHIRDLVGGAGTSSILVGDGTGNVLTGGFGNDLLIAGGGPATLIGGYNSDILIGGSTAYDLNAAALNALMNELDRFDLPFASKVPHLTNGGGLNGNVVLNASTVHLNAGGNTFRGGLKLSPDLYIGSKVRDNNDANPTAGDVFVNLG